MKAWKIATAGIALVVVTAVSTSLGTAYLVRTEATRPDAAWPAIDRERAQPATRPAVLSRVAAPARPAVVREGERPAAQSVARPASQPAPSPPAVRPVGTAAPSDCTTGGDRAWRIAKPGLLGAVLGAGVGAAGGAIADGRKAAGRGALIGGLAGAVLGSGYGAYKTKQECGTILGGGNGGSAAGDRSETHTSTGGSAAAEAAFRPAAPRADDADGIQIYTVR